MGEEVHTGWSENRCMPIDIGSTHPVGIMLYIYGSIRQHHLKITLNSYKVCILPSMKEYLLASNVYVYKFTFLVGGDSNHKNEDKTT